MGSTPRNHAGTGALRFVVRHRGHPISATARAEFASSAIVQEPELRSTSLASDDWMVGMGLLDGQIWLVNDD